jgi:hypothetical protein
MVDTVLMLSSDTSPRPIPETVSRTLLVSGFGSLTEGRASEPPNAPSGFRSRSEYGLYAVLLQMAVAIIYIIFLAGMATVQYSVGSQPYQYMQRVPETKWVLA